MKTCNINLQDYRTPGSKVFTTRPRGLQVRNESKIDSLVKQCDKITVTVPDDISSINPSFLEEFLENVVTSLGETGFYEKVTFINKGRYKIDSDLTEAVERILREESALS